MRNDYANLKIGFHEEITRMSAKIEEYPKREQMATPLADAQEHLNDLKESVADLQAEVEGLLEVQTTGAKGMMEQIRNVVEPMICDTKTKDSSSQLKVIENKLDNHIKNMNQFCATQSLHGTPQYPNGQNDLQYTNPKIPSVQRQSSIMVPPTQLPMSASNPSVPHSSQVYRIPTLMEKEINNPYSNPYLTTSTRTQRTESHNNNDEHTPHARNTTNIEQVDNNSELLILIDSNGNYLDRRKFWSLDKTKYVRCGNILEAGRSIQRTKFTKLKYVLLSIGVSDTDDQDGEEVATRLKELIETVQRIYPHVKIVMNELTPRADKRDDEVVKCNKTLGNIASASNGRIVLATQSNLRDKTYSFFWDAKHVKETKIARYAANLKIALRQVYGMVSPRVTHTNRPKMYQQNDDFPRLRMGMDTGLKRELMEKMLALLS